MDGPHRSLPDNSLTSPPKGESMSEGTKSRFDLVAPWDRERKDSPLLAHAIVEAGTTDPKGPNSMRCRSHK